MRYLDKVMSWALALLGAVLASSFIWLIWLAFSDYQLIKADPIWLVPQQYKVLRQGDTVHTKVKICKYTNKVSTVSTMLIGKTNSGENYLRLLPTESKHLSPGCETFLFGVATIPWGTLPGHYHVAITFTYQVNVLKTVSYQFDTEEFEVLEGSLALTTKIRDY